MFYKTNFLIINKTARWLPSCPSSKGSEFEDYSNVFAVSLGSLARTFLSAIFIDTSRCPTGNDGWVGAYRSSCGIAYLSGYLVCIKLYSTFFFDGTTHLMHFNVQPVRCGCLLGPKLSTNHHISI